MCRFRGIFEGFPTKLSGGGRSLAQTILRVHFPVTGKFTGYIVRFLAGTSAQIARKALHSRSLHDLPVGLLRKRAGNYKRPNRQSNRGEQGKSGSHTLSLIFTMRKCPDEFVQDWSNIERPERGRGPRSLPAHFRSSLGVHL